MNTADSIRLVRITAAVLCVFGAIVLVWQFVRFLVVFPAPATLAVLLQLPPLLIGFVVLRLLRPVRPPSLLWSAAALVWGATAAAGCALLANQGLVGLWAKSQGPGFAANWSASLSAPLNEEVLKLCGVVLIVLAAPLMINGPLDGLVYGALTGLGFQVVENVTYGLNAIALSGATDPARAVLNSALIRVGTTGLGSHWTMTAVAGAGVGFFVEHSRSRVAAGGRVEDRPGWRAGLLPAAICLVIAMAMHLLFDAPHPAAVVKVAVNLIVAGTFYLVLSSRFLGRARAVLTSLASAGLVSPAEARCLLSRTRRLHELRQADSVPERQQLLARQQELLARIDQDAA